MAFSSQNPSQPLYSNVNRIIDTIATMAQEQASLEEMLDILRSAIDLGLEAPVYLVNKAIEVGHMEMDQSHIDQLRENFCLPEEIEALARYLSGDNYAAYMGRQPFEGSIDMPMEEIMDDQPQCCLLQPQGLHVYSCPKYDWNHVDRDAIWGQQMGGFELSNRSAAGGFVGAVRNPTGEYLGSSLFAPNLFDLVESGGPVNEAGASSGRVKVEKGESSKRTATRGRTVGKYDQAPELIQVDEAGSSNTAASGEPMDGVYFELPPRSPLPSSSRTNSSTSSDYPKGDPHCCNRTSSAPHASYCINRDQTIPLWNEPTPESLIPKFELFTKLPHELRITIYELALSSDAVIAPQLCDKAPNGRVQFHDMFQHSRQKPNHIAIARLLGVTRVSKQIREESLPCFYSANTFCISPDAPTYFGYLEYLGRFNMIRRVLLNIPKLNTKFAPQILAQMKTYMSDVKAYEKTHPLPPPIGSTEKKGKTRASSQLIHQGPYEYFANHPRYTTGGLDDMGMLIVVGMLSSSTAPSAFPTHEPSSQLARAGKATHFILPAPSTQIFSTTYPSLTWFPSVLHGLDITLHLVPDYPLRFHAQGSVGIMWRQKFQKTDFMHKDRGGGSSGGDGMDEGMQLDKRVMEMWPDLGEDRGKFWERTSYLRGSCDGMQHVWWEARF